MIGRIVLEIDVDIIDSRTKLDLIEDRLCQKIRDALASEMQHGRVNGMSFKSAIFPEVEK